MGTNTPNYNFFKPDEDDSMADVKKNINDNFRAMLPITKYLSVATLPTLVDNPSVGAVVYLTPAQSLYICIVSDTDWGVHWRPIHAPLSPFVALPSSVVVDPTKWKSNIKLAFDNMGHIYWKGNFEWVAGGFIPDDTPFQIVKNMPKGIRPAQRAIFPVCTDPQSPFQNDAYRGASLYLTEKGDDGYNEIRVYNLNSTIERFVWVDNVFYAVGEGNFVAA